MLLLDCCSASVNIMERLLIKTLAIFSGGFCIIQFYLLNQAVARVVFACPHR
jgi:hypothetical protein